MICRACGGGRAHHSVAVEEDDGGCWCRTCRELPVEQRCKAFDAVAPARRFSGTAKKAGVSRATVSLPREGTMKRQVYDFVTRSGLEGLTNGELQYKTGRIAPVIRAAIAGLIDDGLIEDSGHKRAGDLMSEEEVAWRTRNR